MKSKTQTYSKKLLKYYFSIILNIIWKFILFLILFSIPSYFGCFYNELGGGYIFFSYFIAFVFVIVSLYFKEKLLNRLKFIFSKKIILFGIMIYLIVISIAFYQTHNNINKLKSNLSFKDINIVYEYGAILTSLTPRIKVSLDKTCDTTKSYEIATKLFDMSFDSRLEYCTPAYDLVTSEHDDHYACFYNQENIFLTILQYVLLVYLYIILVYFLITYKMIIEIKQPFVKFEKFEVKKGILVFWFAVLFAMSVLNLVVGSIILDRDCNGYIHNCINTTILNNKKIINKVYYKNNKKTKGENYGL
jgi:hypothetical protein